MKPQTSYTPFTEHEIELIRAVLSDGTYTVQERKDVGKLCDMAINMLRYAEEIHRLRDLPQTMPDVHATLIDAERYRYLRDSKNNDPVQLIFDTNYFGADAPDSGRIDAAIDEARLRT